MPIVQMQKVALLAHHSKQEDLLEFLQEQGVMEITPNAETNTIEHPEVSYQKAEVQFALDFLAPYASKEDKKALSTPGSLENIRHSALHTDFRRIIDECKNLEDVQEALQTEKQENAALVSALSPWKALPFALNTLETHTTRIIFGSVPSDAIAALKSCKHVEILNISQQDQQTLIAALIWKQEHHTFEKLAATHGFTAITLPPLTHSPAEELKRLSVQERVLNGKQEELRRKRKDLAKSLPDLARLAQYLYWIDEKQEARSQLMQTNQTMMLTGWIPARQFDHLDAALEKNFGSVALLPTEPNEGEEPPMQIRNLDVIAPFEAVTRLYGLPQHGEMDPTKPLMPFFILYFGLCLTDAGYGAVLALVMAIVIWKFKLRHQDAKLVWLLLYAGIVTFLVSIPFGGWFGMTPDQAPLWAVKETAAGLRFKGQFWDITKDVDFFRNLALSLGSIQLLFGIFLAGMWKAIHGKVFQAISQHFTVHLFVAALAAQYVFDVPHLQYVLIGLGALFIWGNGTGPWFVRPLTGALGTVSFLIGVMSNILSYLRILALGLATGALAFAINQVALVLKDLLPIFLGIPVFLAILIGGHMISLALNGLGSFVHSGRLQFIEFFGQFFQGGGKEFSPFKRTIRSLA